MPQSAKATGPESPALAGLFFCRLAAYLCLDPFRFVLTQFRTESYGEVTELNRFTLFLELL